MSSVITHAELIEFSKKLLKEVFNIQDLRHTNSHTEIAPCPDLCNDEVCVECGNLNGGEARFNLLLTRWNRAFWIPYPTVVTFGKLQIPTFEVYTFKLNGKLDIDKLMDRNANLEKENATLRRALEDVRNMVMNEPHLLWSKVEKRCQNL